MWHMWNWDGGWGIPWGWVALLHVVWWILVGAGLLSLYQWITGRRLRDSLDGEEPQAILRQRFARGEIDRAEYEERLRVLKG